MQYRFCVATRSIYYLFKYFSGLWLECLDNEKQERMHFRLFFLLFFLLSPFSSLLFYLHYYETNANAKAEQRREQYDYASFIARVKMARGGERVFAPIANRCEWKKVKTRIISFQWKISLFCARTTIHFDHPAICARFH